jgi:hypothetical protein
MLGASEQEGVVIGLGLGVAEDGKSGPDTAELAGAATAVGVGGLQGAAVGPLDSQERRGSVSQA